MKAGYRSKLVLLFTLFSFLNSHLHAQSLTAHEDVIPLEGIWKFKLDAFDTGINANGVRLLPQMPEEITLPGSTDQAGKGYKTQGMTSLRLTRAFEYKGAAWYEKEIYVPQNWKNKEVRLFLERAHWETRLWVNNKPAGKSKCGRTESKCSGRYPKQNKNGH